MKELIKPKKKKVVFEKLNAKLFSEQGYYFDYYSQGTDVVGNYLDQYGRGTDSDCVDNILF
jgi:hypothetical protein